LPALFFSNTWIFPWLGSPSLEVWEELLVDGCELETSGVLLFGSKDELSD
jgi:hypothetical protein